MILLKCFEGRPDISFHVFLGKKNPFFSGQFVYAQEMSALLPLCKLHFDAYNPCYIKGIAIG